MKKLIVMGLTVLPAVFAVSVMGAETINAAGATFPAPIYQQWFSEYKNAHSDVQINYQPIGSSGGIRQLTEGTVDFGASDMPMTDEQLKDMKIKPLHFPTVMGAIVLTYNLQGVSAPLKLTPEIVSGIYLGTVKNWDDAAIKAANPGVKLPSKPVEVIHRSDGSGTTFVFTDYLSKVSNDWKTKVGTNASPSWPLGLGGKGNDGVAGLVKQTPNSIGYVELFYAMQNKMAFADLKNAAGKFIKPSFEGITAAAAGSKDLPADFRGSINNAPGAASYPISTFTYLLIPTEIKDATKKAAIKGFLAWMLTTGQKDAQGLSYAPLPKALVSKVQKQIDLVK
ncbi:MAG TPA: phosphate ABC transporter substrate-binding protein PstS [Bryobacteraceae bacterium]|jgi:phosphate transport system substrate-binding protein|nr:phosphate ABC transporter substrate-binding protein PstS [Bryobacteraceae bacterium]